MTGHLIGHLVRRGVEHLTAKQLYINQLQQDAQAYEDAGPDMEIKPQELLPVLITGIIALFVICSVDYTIGSVIASLAMIESPSRTTIIESSPPAYTEEPDAPLEKEPLMVEEERDVEVIVIKDMPITSKIRGTIAHLHRIGGFRARWRGVGLSAFYHLLHSVFVNLVSRVLGFGLVGEGLAFVFVSLGLARVHMAWTHAMIAYPSSKSWFRRLPSRKDCKVLILPALVYAMSYQLTLVIPLGVAFALGLLGPQAGHFKEGASMHEHCGQAIALGLRFLAVPVTYAVVSLAILLPAAVTLTRVEAALLPEGEETIVDFDKAAVMGDIDVTVRGGCKAVYVQAWKSFDRASRWRLIKLYAKLFLIQTMVAMTAVQIMVAELYVIAGDRLPVFFKSASAQLKLMAIEAHENQENH